MRLPRECFEHHRWDGWSGDRPREGLLDVEGAKRKYEVIPDSSELKGVLTTGNYICPKCDGNEVFVELVQTRSSDEPETRILTCKGCKHGWREY